MERRAEASAAAEASQAEVVRQMQAKDAEILALRAEVQKLQAALEKTPSAATADPAGGDTTATAPLPQAGGASPANAAGIQKWQQPDGALYFGERPPPGSKFLGYTTGAGL